MIRVYRVIPLLDDYQYFVNANYREGLAPTIGGFDCSPLADAWVPQESMIYRPQHTPGDFYQASGDVLITSPRATDMLREHLEAAGELLPLSFEGQVYTVLNVTQCVDCLDTDASTWLWDEERTYRGLKPLTYVFHANRLPEATTLFKVPETCHLDLLVVEGKRTPEGEFIATVERNGLRGIGFKLLWEREAD